jgi:hypothetical protein
MWWFIYGLILGAGGMALRNWVVAGNITVGSYVWPLMLLALALGTLAGHNFFASRAELEPKAARMGLLFIGLPALALSGVVVWLFV